MLSSLASGQPRLAIALRITFAALACLAVASCSLVQLGYGHAPRLVSWYLDDYVSLTSEQTDLLRGRLARLQDWHCRTQVATYALWLRQAHGDARAGVRSERVEERFEQALGHLRTLGRAAAPHASALLGTFSPAQVEELTRSFEKHNAEYREEWVEIPQAAFENKRIKAATKRLEGWIGSLTMAQERIVAAWSRALVTGREDLLENRRRWQAGLRDALARRSDGDAFAERIRQLMSEPERVWTEDYGRKVKANREITFRMLADIAATLDEDQHGHLAREVAGTAAELERLSCVGRPAPAARPEAAAHG